MTVSRVLRNRGDVSDATRKRVLAAAKDLGYVPNQIAGSLASQRVNLVASSFRPCQTWSFPKSSTASIKCLEDTPLQPVVGVSDYMPEKEERVLYEMLSWRPSGVIMAGLEHSDASRAMLQNAAIPVVEIMDTDGTSSGRDGWHFTQTCRDGDGQGDPETRVRTHRVYGHQNAAGSPCAQTL